jgi:hypothetical protein
MGAAGRGGGEEVPEATRLRGGVVCVSFTGRNVSSGCWSEAMFCRVLNDSVTGRRISLELV